MSSSYDIAAPNGVIHAHHNNDDDDNNNSNNNS